jgi:chromosome segregation protein
MRLKKIKMSGFKSFVDPTTISFITDKTGIIGPNGCGKSNIIDAVRWVMGETSKQIRGDKMEDVIFNGSADRKPVGQASIELIFDNSEGKAHGQYAKYNEISVRRDAARDSQSKYFLNGTRCRRRDVIDLFLGTGLGPRSYAIIEQGMISKLIDAKPEELRVYVEEAAGISKYRERRRETETRIQHTRENLDRINDLRGEVQKQLDHLERQKKQAEKYNTLKEDHKRISSELTVLMLKGYELEKQERQTTVSVTEVETEKENAELQAILTNIEKQRDTLTAINSVFNETQAQYYQCASQVSSIEQRMGDKKSNQDAVKDMEQQISSEKEEINKKNIVIENLGGEVEHKLKDSLSSIESSREKLAALKNVIDVKKSDHLSLQGKLASLHALNEENLTGQDGSFVEWLKINALDSQPKLADIIEVEKGWEKAVDLVLSNKLHAITTSSLQQHISNAEKLESGEVVIFKRRPGVDKTSKELLLSKVKCDSDLSSFFYQIFCAETTSDALEFQKNISSNESVVSKEGVWLGKDWAVIKGKKSVKNEFLSRKAEIDNLTAKENEEKKSISSLESEYRQKEKAYTDLQNDREELHEQKLQLELARSEKVSLERSLEKNKKLHNTIITPDSSIEDLSNELQKALQLQKDADDKVTEKRKEVESTQESISLLERDRLSQDSKIQKVQETLNEKKMEVRELEVRSETLLDDLKSRDIDIDTIKENLDENANIAEWEKKENKFSERITRMGLINLASIEEFNQQTERKEYLDSQLNDLTEALSTLESAIAKIDKETRSRFKDTFEKINLQLQETFPKLFGHGAEAQLVMTEHDLLRTGVAVYARPPGKRLSSMNLLSGGEKALTAVAILFSLFALNPAPFCILDEVDAPLDDANVGRFCEIVKDMSSQVQFIIITHNKTTMEYTNQLIGVTMTEPGVSRLVSVDIDDAMQMTAS